MNRADRGSFDRGDLKEVGGATVRAMEPQAVFCEVGACDCGEVPRRTDPGIGFDARRFAGR